MSTPLPLRDYQQHATEQIQSVYDAGGCRVVLQLPCGTGKTVVASQLVAQATGRCVLFVPTVALLSQTIERLSPVAGGRPIVAVTGDVSIEGDLPVSAVPLSRSRVTTDPEVLGEILTEAGESVVVIATYTSSWVVAQATDRPWDVMICDEAHRTTGFSEQAWAVPLNDDLIAARRRLFMTATTKTVTAEDSDDDDLPVLEVLSMDSVHTYGPVVAPLSWREAIRQGFLADYEVAIIGVSEASVLEAIQAAAENGAVIDPRQAAAHLALLRARDTHPHVRSVLAFHNRIAESRQWVAQFEALAAVDDRAAEVQALHVDATSSHHDRDVALEMLRTPGEKMSVVSNCQVFSEGIDVPALDAVVLAAPRRSPTDLVQIIGRALRPHPNRLGNKALIILPVIDADGTGEVDVTLSRSSYRAVWELLASLAEVDEQVTASTVARLGQLFQTGQADGSGQQSEVVSVDTSMLAVGASLGFELRTLQPAVSNHPVTVRMLRLYAAEHGHANPSSGVRYGVGAYPLGSRVAAARRAYGAGVLAKEIVAMYEAVPGFQWRPDPKQVRLTDEQYVELMEQFVASTGVHRILPFQTIQHPDFALAVPIGKKAHDWKWRKRLSAALRERVEACMAGQ